MPDGTTPPDDLAMRGHGETAGRGGGQPRRRSRLAQDVPGEVVAQYTMARAFLLGEWFGATLMVASFTLLYLLQFGAHASTAVTYVVCAACLLVGSLAFFRGRAYYERAQFPYATRWHNTAAIVAGAAGIFWLLFLLLVTLAWAGVPLQ